GLLAREGRSLVVRDVVSLEQRIADSRAEQEPCKQAVVDGPRETPPIAFARQRRAVLVAQAAGAVEMMERDEERTVKRWRAYLAHAMSETIPLHSGRTFPRELEHGFVAEFPEGRLALKCAF